MGYVAGIDCIGYGYLTMMLFLLNHGAMVRFGQNSVRADNYLLVYIADIDHDAWVQWMSAQKDYVAGHDKNCNAEKWIVAVDNVPDTAGDTDLGNVDLDRMDVLDWLLYVPACRHTVGY